ncbi:MAG TPA: arginase family protein, partial [Longimicrobiales bacterium]|nr:arginase family protein [Longimicrobiales bacterium]
NLGPPPYRDFERPPGRPRNEDEVAAYSHALAREVAAADRDDFLLVLGGDCSIVLGCLLGLRGRGDGRVALAYIDAHADFASPEESVTGSAASMCLAQAVGRGDTVLARLGGEEPLVREEDVVVIARSDHDVDGRYGEAALRAMPVLDLALEDVRERGPGEVAGSALGRLTSDGIDGFWIHVDADVIDPAVVPAVDSPEPDGLSLEELESLLTPLVNHPRARGMELTIYDPELDPDRTSAGHLVDLLERVLGGGLAESGGSE